MALAAVEGVDDLRLHVDEQHALAGFGEGRRERHADIAGADHGHVVLGCAGTALKGTGQRDAFRSVAVAVQLGRVVGETRRGDGGRERFRLGPGCWRRP